MLQMITVPFHGICSANSELNLVSERIPFRFAVRRIQVGYAPGCNRLLRIKVFVSQNATVPNTGQPPVQNVIVYVQSSYIVGDDGLVDVPHDFPGSSGSYLKVYANNTDGFDHVVDVRVIIERTDGAAR